MARLADVSPGDLITSQRQNDINDYIEDGTEYLITASAQLVATSSAPSDGDLALGRLYADSDDDKLYFYNGSGWVDITGSGSVNRYAEAITSETDVNITHSLGDSTPVVQVYDNNNEQITPDVIDITDSNTVNLKFAVATTGNVVVLGGTTGVSSFGMVPIGGIIAWMKSISGVPALPGEFVECNGGTVSDAASPINGQTIPTLNSGTNRMLRGNTTSGSTGGADTHTLSIPEMPAHTHTSREPSDRTNSSTGGNTPYDGYDTNATSSTGGGGAHNNLPGYTEVVWIMRIK